MSNRCTSTNSGDRCRLWEDRHKTDWLDRPIHKYWNSYNSRSWKGAVPGISRAAIASMVLVLFIAIFPSHFPTPKESWFESPVPAIENVSCSVWEPTPAQSVHQEASCIHAIGGLYGYTGGS